jgi:hypothetical protein
VTVNDEPDVIAGALRTGVRVMDAGFGKAQVPTDL